MLNAKDIELHFTIRIVLCNIELNDTLLISLHNIELRSQNLGFSLCLDVKYHKC
jgi:hypothetical protein